MLETICVGGQATVYRGFHPSLLIDVVIKLAHEPSQRDQTERARLVTEAKALAEIIHPNMARLYDLDFHEDRPYLVLEFVRGKCLSDYRDQKEMTPSESALLVSNVARAVACAHERGILHLDLKPDNIMVTPRGEPVLIDFGMSNLTGSRSASSPKELCIAGTPQYMSPEQTRGRSCDLDSRTDVFGLGAVLYELCVGGPPFEVEVDQQIGEFTLSTELHWHRLSHAPVPRSLKQICRKAMSRDPRDRYGSATEFANVLEESSRKLDRRPIPCCRVAAVLALMVGLVSLFLATLFPSADNRPEATLGLQVIRGETYLPLKDALPLSATDRVRLLCDIDAGSRTGVVVVNESGPPQWLGPLKSRSTPEMIQAVVRGSSQLLSLSEQTDTLLFLLVIRRDEPIHRGEIREMLPFQRLLPKIPSHTAVIFRRNQFLIVKPAETDVEPVDAEYIQQQLNAVRQKLSDRYDDFAGVLVSKNASSVSSTTDSTGAPW
ncbi:MAG: serine/threonine protein kinase [Planctomycetaceae bacterium]|nr:serine/threonine protein kinase [Planctomycetaceae bacterium]